MPQRPHIWMSPFTQHGLTLWPPSDCQNLLPFIYEFGRSEGQRVNMNTAKDLEPFVVLVAFIQSSAILLQIRSHQDSFFVGPIEMRPWLDTYFWRIMSGILHGSLTVTPPMTQITLVYSHNWPMESLNSDQQYAHFTCFDTFGNS